MMSQLYRRRLRFALRLMRRTILTATVTFSLCFWAPVAFAQGVEDAIRQAEAEGLPVAALKDKVREGQAKGVPAPRIAAVVQKLAQHMREMRPLLKKGKQAVPNSLLVATAAARLAGVDRATLRRVAPAGSDRGVARRVDALVDLQLRGYAAKKSVELVQRTPKAELAGVGMRAERMRKRGLTRGEVLDSMTRSVRSSGTLRGAGRAAGAGPGGGPGPGAGGGAGAGAGAGQGQQTRYRGGR